MLPGFEVHKSWSPINDPESIKYIPPKIRECPVKMQFFFQKESIVIVFQPSFFRGYVSFEG